MHIGVLIVARQVAELDPHAVWESLLEFEALLNSQCRTGHAGVLLRIESDRRPRGVRSVGGRAAALLKSQIADGTLQAVSGVCMEGPDLRATFTALLSVKEDDAADWPSVLQADLYSADGEDPELHALLARALQRTSARMDAYAAYAFDGAGGMDCANHMLKIGRSREARRWRPNRHIHGVEPIVVLPPQVARVLGGEKHIRATLGHTASGFEYSSGQRAVIITHAPTFSQAQDAVAARGTSHDFLRAVLPHASDVTL